MPNSENNKRIAKNTAMLYVRMLLTMAVSLYTSRIVLNTLGIEDFGIYNVVAGFVTMFSFLNNAMSLATQRFLSIEIGKKDFTQLRNIFSMSVNIHFIIALAIFILAETIGLWFVNNQLMISTERIVASNWVYQFSILALMINILSVPYNALIIAHERMNMFAWIGIIEVSLKLFIVFILVLLGFDKLKLYAVLLFCVSLIISLIYGFYCTRNFKESTFRLFWDKTLYRTLMSYTGWNLWGNLAGVLKGQGANVLINIFFGPTVNAARGIAFQVMGAVNSFVQNFQMAINPQIIKSYAVSDLKYMHQLIFQSAKFSFFLLFALSLPILFETEIILKVWLRIVPEYTVIFTQLVIINILIDTISNPLMIAAQATGKIKLYQITVGGLLLLILPISYLFLKFGFQPQITLYISILISIIALFARLRIISPLVKLTVINYVNNVIFRILPVTFLACILPFIIRQLFPQGFLRLIIMGVTSFGSVVFAIYKVGLSLDEKIFMQKKLRKLLLKIKNE